MEWDVTRLLDADAQAAALRAESVVDYWPEDPESHLHHLVRELAELPMLRVFRAEFDYYGYESFVQVMLTRRDNSLVSQRSYGVVTTGFGLLLSRLAPVAAFQRSAHATTGSFSVPEADDSCACPVPGFWESYSILEVLERHHYDVADPEILLEPIAPGLTPDTNMGGRPTACSTPGSTTGTDVSRCPVVRRPAGCGSVPVWSRRRWPGRCGCAD